MPPGMIPDEDESEDGDDGHGSVDTGAATKGSDPIMVAGFGMNADAAHSTVIIKQSRSSESERDDSASLASSESPSDETPSGQ